MTARNDDSKPKEHVKESAEERALKPYQFLMCNVLREYLALELSVETPFPMDIERLFDDFGKQSLYDQKSQEPNVGFMLTC